MRTVCHPSANHPWSPFLSCPWTIHTHSHPGIHLPPTLSVHSAAGHLEASATTVHMGFSLVWSSVDAALQRRGDGANLLEALCWQLPEAISSSELLVPWLLFPHPPLCLDTALIPTPRQLSTFFFRKFTSDHFARVSQFCHYNCHRVLMEDLLS